MKSNYLPELPERAAYQIDNFFRELYRGKSAIRYQYFGGSNSVSKSLSIFHSNNSPDALIVITYNKQGEWPKTHYKVEGTDPEVVALVKPIVEKYCIDIEAYHSKTA